MKLENKIGKVNKPGPIPPQPGNGLQTSSRRRRPVRGFPKRGRGVEPEGANGLLWKARRDMKRMFEAGKLVRETIVTDPTASKLSERQEGSQAPSSTAPSSKSSNKPQKEKDYEGIMSAQGKQQWGETFPPAMRLPRARHQWLRVEIYVQSLQKRLSASTL